MFTCTPMRARIVLFLEFQHAIDPSICCHISICTYHNYIRITLSYPPRTVAACQPGCQLPRRRHAATISAQIYYTPTLDSVIVTVAQPAATAAPPSSRQPTRSPLARCGHRLRTGRSHSQQQIEYALRFYITDVQIENAFRITNV